MEPQTNGSMADNGSLCWVCRHMQWSACSTSFVIVSVSSFLCMTEHPASELSKYESTNFLKFGTNEQISSFCGLFYDAVSN
jgi:hypothetical protein